MDTAIPLPAKPGQEWIEGKWAPSGPDGTYYGLPSLKHSHYRWTAGASFFLAGIAGACEVFTTIIDLAGDPGERPIVRAGRYLVPATAGASALLYIKDLGTPRRWFNMLRIFRPTSFMSIGSWALTTLGAKAGIMALIELLGKRGYDGKARLPGRLANIPGIVPGSLLAFYMGGELEETSTPLWSSSAPFLPPLFAAANTVNALSVLEMTAVWKNAPDASLFRIGALALISGMAELVMLRMVERKWLDTGEDVHLRKLHRKLLYRTGFISLARVAAMTLRVIALYTRSRALLMIASLATLAAGFFLPAALLFAGNTSADRPRDYFSHTDRPSLVSGKTNGNRNEKPGAHRKNNAILRRLGLAFGAFAVTGLVYIALNTHSGTKEIAPPDLPM